MVNTYYPDKIYSKNSADSVYNEETGDYELTEGGIEVLIGVCRLEVGSGSKQNTTDGEVYIYSWIAYAPLEIPNLKEGQILRIVGEDGVTKTEKQIIQFSRGKFNCRVWL